MRPPSKPYSMITGKEIVSVKPCMVRDVRLMREQLMAEGMSYDEAYLEAYRCIKMQREEWDRQNPPMSAEEFHENLSYLIANGYTNEQRHWIDTNEPLDRTDDERRLQESFNK